MAFPNIMKIKEIQGEGLRQKLLKEWQQNLKGVLFALSCEINGNGGMCKCM